MKEDDKMQGIHRRLVKQYHEETKDDAHPPEHGRKSVV